MQINKRNLNSIVEKCLKTEEKKSFMNSGQNTWRVLRTNLGAPKGSYTSVNVGECCGNLIYRFEILIEISITKLIPKEM